MKRIWIKCKQVNEKNINNCEMKNWDPMQLVLHIIPIEWLRLKVNFFNFQSQSLNKKLLKNLKSKMWKIHEREKGIALMQYFLNIAWDLNPRNKY